MRILHTSHTGLPDPRVEKTALTMKKKGHELLFLGGRPVKSQGLDAFAEVYTEPIVNNLRLVLDSRFRKRWIKRIDAVAPDVVHAHNLIVAAMMLKTEYPVIYDDHEYWSKQSFKYAARSFIKRIAVKPLERASPRWEREILERYPVLTVSEGIAAEHREHSNKVFVTKNFPSLKEVDHIVDQEDRSGVVYVGNDFELPSFLPHRNMEGLRETIDFQALSGFSHDELMTRLSHFKVGLTPWQQHPFHMYADPNKHYEYLNAGLQVFVTDSLYHPFENEKYVHSFADYTELPPLIDSLPDISGRTIMEHARKQYIWEKQERIIESAYDLL